ncbi:unnamed protein product [Bursaphelenchus okinawaensis]|uniref:alanine--tRNA ligase n=1 Tax=Bursaphelenchus okinawaensis TaxID=465554 RepID=A0A811K922_9BILA|nr:unnamed protein product [Bursaphelenchus okinawaensis]CAG9094617.1 unnamed protein product [Bursaphelenchus okinawaensis]
MISRNFSLFTRRYASNLSGSEVKHEFLRFFEQKAHKIVPSGSVIADDPTLAFTNAGMNQFKPIFLGQVESCFPRVANSQICIRTGGKHNDLEDVGRDMHHQTMFEMLGNWSFGDYYNKEACEFAWEFLTEKMKIPAHRLYVTYFNGDRTLGLKPDIACRDIWRSLGVLEGHIVPAGYESNFWEMADRGPCGPCTEIHVDRRDRTGQSHLVNVDGSDVIELWNLVFMQYNRTDNTVFESLPTKNIDCGMGFERLVSIVQGVDSNYRTDLFMPLLKKIDQLSEVEPNCDEIEIAYRILADHLRAVPVALAGGANPSANRFRALRAMLKHMVTISRETLNIGDRLPELVEYSLDFLGLAFPQLQVEQNRKLILKTIAQELKAQGKYKRTSELAFFDMINGLKRGEKLSVGKQLYLFVNFNCKLEWMKEFGERKGVVLEDGFDKLYEEYRVTKVMPWTKTKSFAAN